MRTHAMLTAPALLSLALGACSDGDSADFDLDVGTVTEALSSVHAGELEGRIDITVDVSVNGLNGCTIGTPANCLRLCFREDNCYPLVIAAGQTGVSSWQLSNQWDLTTGTDHPYVYSAEGWDRAYLKGPEGGTIELGSLAITYRSRFLNDGGEEMFPFLNHTFNPRRTFTEDDSRYWLTNHIAWRREQQAETVINSGLVGQTVTASQLPLAIRAAVHNQGQSGEAQYSGCGDIWPGGTCTGMCAVTAGWYMLNFSRNFVRDFAPNATPTGNDNTVYRCDPASQRCYDYWAGWLVPDQNHPAYPTTRRIARAKFANDLPPRGALTGFFEVKTTAGTTSLTPDTSTPYMPKPGDTFHRVDRCVGQGQNNPNNQHSMVLVTYPHVVGNSLDLVVFDAGSMGLIRHSTNQLPINTSFSCNHDTGCDLNGSEWKLSSGAPLCPDTNGQVVSRYEYLVGITDSPEEWYVSEDGTATPNRIGEDVINLPVDDQLRAQLNNSENPSLTDLKAFDYDGDDQVLPDFDGDDRADVFTRDSKGRWYASYSSENYQGWHLLSAFEDPNEHLFFGDFGTDSVRTAPDRHDDIMRFYKKSDGYVWLQVAFWTSTSTSPTTWKDVWRFNKEFTVDFWYDHARLIDIDGDQLVDAFYQATDGRWYLRRGAAQGNQTAPTWKVVRTNVPNSLSTYRFFNHNPEQDGFTDVFQIVTKANGRRTWQICPFDGTDFVGSSCPNDTATPANNQTNWKTLRSTLETLDVEDVRVGRFLASGTPNVIRDHGGHTYLLQPTSSSNWNGTWVERTDFASDRPFAELIFADMNGDGDLDVFSYEKDRLAGLGR